jgi:D-alanyl-D-alanine carboxypeptidase
MRSALFARAGLLLSTAFLTWPLAAQQPTGLAPELRAAIDQAAEAALLRSGAPSASIAVVTHGALAYTAAYGSAKLDPKTPALPAMRYSIGSNSKQFTATAALMLAEQGKLSLDDKVARYFPDLTRANEITLRQLLSMTSGYQDYWPQDYLMPNMLLPVTGRQILDQWARKPLDFDPGTKWQYSNTNYVLAGQIIEKVSGEDLYSFLRKRVFTRLGMTTVFDVDAGPLPAADPVGYRRFGLGPLRPALKEGPGWLSAAGELAMTAADLARWDIAMMRQTLLKPESYRQQQTTTLLKNGVATRYGLGVFVGLEDGRRVLSHGGEVMGFTSSNNLYPDDQAAIVVFTNQDAVSTSETLADEIARLLFHDNETESAAATARARQIFLALERGQLDRAQFTENANFYFSEEALRDFAASLAPCGEPSSFVPTGRNERGGMIGRSWRVRCGDRDLQVWTFELPDGKLEQYQIAPIG